MIPDEAVEAAARVIAVVGGDVDETYFHYLARKALEAAAPHIRSQALVNAADTLEAADPMHQAQYVAFLRVCALSETKDGAK